MATERERQLFVSEVLAAVGQQAVRLHGLKITGFMAMVGCRYACARDLMVVGRAVNGWDEGVFPKNLSSADRAEEYSRTVLASVNGTERCPMRWVTESWGSTGGCNPNRSAFWRTIRRVVAKLKIADVEQDPWSSHLVWSNLYKIAPAAGGNPDSTLCHIQLAGCIKLFRLELTTYTPSRLLLLTGTEWASPFLSCFGSRTPSDEEFCYVEEYGTLTIVPDKRPIQYIIAAHPQAKPENQWVEGVCGAFNSLERKRGM